MAGLTLAATATQGTGAALWTQEAGPATGTGRNAQAPDGGMRTASGSGATRGSGPGSLGPDAFFRLLSAQLRYQDPLQPMQDTEFIAQLAQFTQLEETRGMRQALAGFAALSLLGRAVEVTTGGGKTSGTVTGVYLDPEDPALAVGGVRIPWADVVSLRLLEDAAAAAMAARVAAGQAAQAGRADQEERQA